ncbi:MAG: MerR family transcriptional regulator [Candidatus Binatia bacterium]
MGEEIPSDKLYFKIGEVARLVGVKPYVLRYWETEFSIVRPGKSKSRQRLYRRKDVEMLLRIKELLHDRRFTIEGARRHLKAELGGQASDQLGRTQAQKLREIRDILLDLRQQLG